MIPAMGPSSDTAAGFGRLAGWTSLLALTVGCGTNSPTPSPSRAEPPPLARHLVLVSLDTLRADRLGCHGYGRPTSPVLDALAARGIRFAEHSAPSSKTAPSHMTMFTGTHPTVHGVRNYYGSEAHAPAPELRTLPELARAAGFRTAAFTGGGMLSGELGFDRGFDHYDDRGGGVEREFGRALEWLADTGADLGPQERVFLFVHTYEIHDPYTPPAPWQERFVDPHYAGRIDSTRIELPEDAAALWKTDPGFYEAVQQRFWGGFDGQSPADFEHLSNLYDAGIAYTDHWLGRLVEGVEQHLGTAQAWIVVTSDHGEEFGERGGVSHQTIFEEILHVPLVVIPPRASTAYAVGRAVSAPVMGADLGPSLAELLGLPPLPAAQGRSWVPWLEAAAEADPWRPLWAELGTPQNPHQVLRRGPYKLHRERGGETQLYDLWFDPRERFDRAADLDVEAARLAAEFEAQDRENRRLGALHPAVAVQLGDAALGALHALGYAQRAEPAAAEPSTPGGGEDPR
jgi:arylsulfatase A-like enzyme